MSFNKRWLILGLVLIIVLFVCLRPVGHKNPVIGDTDPEKGGPQSVSIENTEKLAALVPSYEFFIVKGDLSDYIIKYVSPKAQSATIETTQLDNNGTIDLSVSAQGKRVNVLLDQTSTQLTFQVPSTHYVTTNNIVDPNSEDDGDD
jgi:hypothetical protein